jgi:shikimate dehydrogenase
MDVFGLIGHPVSHSMSKAMHEAAFKELNLPYTYELFDVTEDKLESFLQNAGFKGLNVTIPLKIAAVKHMDRLTKEALFIGAVNTVEFNGGKMIGHNTDAIGFMQSLKEAGVKVAGKKVLILGAGGAGRGITFKLAQEKANVSILNRDSKKASALSDEILKKVGKKVNVAASIESLHEADILVNATSVGMSPNLDESLVPKELLRPNLTVVELVYNPIETRLLREATGMGCKTVDGVGMLVHQGAESQRIWLGVNPPIDAMRKAVLDNLKSLG